MTELFGSARCPYTAEMRNWLELAGRDWTERNVDSDQAARTRLRGLGQSLVPVLVVDGKVERAGWLGRGCMLEPG
jgi:glutaredoxin